MRTAAEILQKYDLHPASTAPGRFYTACPKCSAGRSKPHQNARCLGITIDDKGVHFGCSHCSWTGGEFYNGKANGKADNFAATYDYHDAHGNLQFQKVRNQPGAVPPFWCRRPDGRGGWIKGIAKDVARPLYCLPQISEAIASGYTVLVAEGEKDVDNLWRIGLPATCNFDGAAKPEQQPKWKAAYSKTLSDADVVVLNDNDAQGYAHADAIVKSLTGIAARVRRLDLALHWPDCPKGGDVSDWLALGHTREELDALIETAPDFGTAQDEGTQPNPVEIFWHGEKRNVEARPWLVHELLPQTGKGLMSGQWGFAKTFCAIDLAGSVMTAQPFAGRAIDRRGGVLFIAAEGASEIPIRIDGVEQKFAAPDAAGERPRLPFAWIAEYPSLKADNAVDDVVAIADTVAARMKTDFDLPLALVVIDTLSASADFADANDAAEAQRVMNKLETVSRRTGAFVLAVDHFGKLVETGTRGSSAKEASADVVLALLGDRRINGAISNTSMAVRKLRGGSTGAETSFDLKVISLGDGLLKETTCVIEWQPERKPTQQTAHKDRWPRSLRVFRSAMTTALTGQGKLIQPYENAGPTVRAVPEHAVRTEFMAAYPADSQKDAKRMAFKRALKDARERELICSREVGGLDYLWLVNEPDEPNIHANKPNTL
jgi:hypothetical protein